MRFISGAVRATRDLADLVPVFYRGFSTFKPSSLVRRVELPPLAAESISEYFCSLEKADGVVVKDLPSLNIAKEFAANIGGIAEKLADGGDKKSQEFLHSIREFKSGKVGVLHVVGMPFSPLESGLLSRFSASRNSDDENKIIQSHLPMIYAAAGVGFLAGYEVNSEDQKRYKRVLTASTSYQPAHCDGAFYDKYAGTDMFSLSVLSLNKEKSPTFVLSAKKLCNAVPKGMREVLFQPIFYSSYTDNRFPIFFHDKKGNLQINFRFEEALNFCEYGEDNALFSDFPEQSRSSITSLCETIKYFLESDRQESIEYENAGDTAFINNKSLVHGARLPTPLEGTRVLSKHVFRKLKESQQSQEQEK